MFPGAHDALETPAYAIVGAPMEHTTSFYPGTRFGPERIRHFAGHFEDYDRRTDQHFSDLGVLDHGDVTIEDDTADSLAYLRSTLAGYRLDGAVPLVLGGEHTVSLAGVRACDPATYVAIDAHLDLRESYAGATLSHATTTRRALEHVDHAVIVGARSGSAAAWDRATETDVTVVGPDGVGQWTPDLAAPVYLSLDIDAVDPSAAPGTGTPEPFGLSPATVRELVADLAPASIGFDVVEVNDRDDGQAATLAAKLVRRFVYAHAAAQP